jgi:cytochrome c peroxidase
MAKHQLGAEMSEKDVKNVASFLATMTGPLDESYIAKPTLPESGPDTPKPDPS